MLKIEKGIFCTAIAGEHRREGRPGEQGGEHDQHHPGADVRRQEAVHRDRRRVAGEHEAEGDVGAGEGGAQDPQPGERGEGRLRGLQDDAGGDRPGAAARRACRRACRSSRRPGSRAGRGRRSSRATPPTQATIRASRRGSDWAGAHPPRRPAQTAVIAHLVEPHPAADLDPAVAERADEQDRAPALVDRHRPGRAGRRARSPRRRSPRPRRSRPLRRSSASAGSPAASSIQAQA